MISDAVRAPFERHVMLYIVTHNAGVRMQVWSETYVPRRSTVRYSKVDSVPLTVDVDVLPGISLSQTASCAPQVRHECVCLCKLHHPHRTNWNWCWATSCNYIFLMNRSKWILNESYPQRPYIVRVLTLLENKGTCLRDITVFWIVRIVGRRLFYWWRL